MLTEFLLALLRRRPGPEPNSISVCNPIGEILGNVLIHGRKMQMKTFLIQLRNSRILGNVLLEFHINPVSTLAVVVY